MNKKALGLQPFVINLVLVVLFIFVLFSFVSSFLAVTNPSSPIFTYANNTLNNSMNNMNYQINRFNNVSKDVQTQMAGQNPDAVNYLFLIFKGAFYIPLTFLEFTASSIIAVGSTILVDMMGLGEGGILMAVILDLIVASIIATFVLIIVKSIRTGDTTR